MTPLRTLALACKGSARVTVFSRAWFDEIRAHRNQPIRLGEDDGGPCAVVWCAVEGVEVSCNLPIGELHADEARGIREAMGSGQPVELVDAWAETRAKDRPIDRDAA